MGTMKTNKITCILALVLGMVSSASAGAIVVVDWTGSLDIPDGETFETSYLVSDVPPWGRVTGISYEVIVDDRDSPINFWCSDYQIGLSSTARGEPGDYLLVWDNAGGQTDQNADSDLSDDSDIDLSRTTNAFNGQEVNQRWYICIRDTVVSHSPGGDGLGCLKKMKLTIQYVVGPEVYAPSVSTQAATEVTPYRATLNGQILDDGDGGCEYQFALMKEGGEYVLSPYSGGPGFTGLWTGDSFKFTWTDLEPDSKYYFVATAKNSAGESAWPENPLSFTTPTLGKYKIRQPTVTTEAAKDITGQTATLSGIIDDDGGEGCKYQFEYYIPGTFQVVGEEYYNLTPHSEQSEWIGEHFSSILAGLDPNRTYSYRVRAKNSAGEGPCGPWLFFTTPVIPPTVINLPATHVTETGARLNGRLTNDGGESCQYTFCHRRAGSSILVYTPWTGRKFTDDSLYEDVNLPAGDKYYFCVYARNTAGASSGGLFETFTTLPVPDITDIRGTHFTPGLRGLFLDGVSLTEKITVSVCWNGLEPNEVLWYINGSLAYRDNCQGNPDGPQATRYFDVGKDFGKGGYLAVAATAKKSGIIDVSSEGLTVANFWIIPQPPMADSMKLSPVSTEWGEDFCDLRYESGYVPLTIFDDSAGDFGYTIPDGIPIFGGYGVEHVLQARDKMTVKGRTAEEQYLVDVGCVKFAGVIAEIDSGYRKDLLYKVQDPDGSGYWSESGWLWESCYAHYPIWYLGLTICGKGVWVDVGTDLNLYNEFAVGSPWTGEVKVDPKIWAEGGCDFEVVSLEVTAKGGLKFHVRYLQGDVSKTELEKFCINMYLKVKGSLGAWKLKVSGSWEDSWQYCPIDKSESAAFYVSLASSDIGETSLGADGWKWELMARDYLGADYAVWLPPTPDERHSRGDLSVLSAATRSQASAGGEQVLQANIFENSQPTLATDKGELLMAWVYDDPSRSSVNRTEIVLSRSDGGTWTPPVPIWDDGTADMSPQLAVLPSGQLLCVWENANRLLSDDEELGDMASALEIAVASYDSTTGLWSTKTLTSDSHLDRTPRIATAANSTAVVVWVSNDKDDILGVDPNAPDIIRYCFWNGSTWSQPGTAATGIGSTLKTALAYNGTRAVYAYTIDTDGDPVTDGDHEIYALVYDGSRWSQPIRVTNDNVADVNPQIVFDGEGEVLLVWYREGSIVSCRNLNIGTLRQVFQPNGAGARNFRLAKGPAGHISLVWTTFSTKSEGRDVFCATYDPLLAVWSNVYPLTSDIDEEAALTAAYVNSDELALAYDKGRIRTDAEGDQETYRTDLCVLRHKLVSDLAVLAEDISVTPTNPKPGDTVNITAVIHNIGGFAEADVPVGFYYGDPADTGYGWLIGDVQVIKGPIVAGGTGEATVSWTIPDTNNLQDIYVVVDPPSHSDHDVASIQVLVPDLTVDSVQWEKTTNNIRRITALITNQGVGSAHNVGAKIRLDSPRGQEVHGFIIPVINADSSREVSWTWDISGMDFNDPEIVLCVVADGDQRIPESDEENNTGLCVLHVSKTADLTDDGSVDVEDLAGLFDHWLNQDNDSDWQPDCDLNHDGHIDLKDFSILGKDWNWEAIWHTE